MGHPRKEWATRLLEMRRVGPTPDGESYGLACGNCGEERFHARVVAKGLADVGEAVHIAGAKDKAAAQLKGILDQFFLNVDAAATIRNKPMEIFKEAKQVVTGRLGAFAGGGVVGAQQVKQVGFAQAGGLVGLVFLVDEQRKVDLSLVAKEAGIVGAAQSDGDKVRTLLLELGFVVTQLRDVLAAEDSTPMAEEYDHGGAGRPERTELYGFTVGIGQGDGREGGGERCHREIVIVGLPFVTTSVEGCEPQGIMASSGQFPPYS